VLLNEAKPIAAPSEIARHVPTAGQSQLEPVLAAVARNVSHRDFSIKMQDRLDGAYGRINPHQARLEPPQISQ
jgi:hypothetical protein